MPPESILAQQQVYLVTRLKSLHQRRAQKRSTLSGKLNLMRLYFDYPKFRDQEKYKSWRDMLESYSSKELTLREKRQVADFYGDRELQFKKELWLNRLLNHIVTSPSPENLREIADSAYLGLPAFLCNKDEKTATRLSLLLSLHIYKYLYHFATTISESKKEEIKMIINHTQVNETDSVILPSLQLVPFSYLRPFEEDGPTFMFIEKLFYVIYALAEVSRS